MCTAHPWLAATPDGWVTDPEASPSQGLVEFKNLYSYRDLAVSDAIAAKKCDCLAINNGCIELKHTYGYYYQVQMAMFCTKKEWCDFLLCTTIDYQCEQVQFDKSFCDNIMVLHTLQQFYILVILPELALKAKPIQEPKDWLTEEDSFLQEMEE